MEETRFDGDAIMNERHGADGEGCDARKAEERWAAEMLKAAIENQIPDESGDVIWWMPASMTSFEEELSRELSEDHPLFGRKLEAVAKSDRADDVLFLGQGEVFLVHLTYAAENQPPFPLFVRIAPERLGEHLAAYRESC